MQILLELLPFKFVIEYKENPIRFLAENAEDNYEIGRISSQTDAEGWIGIEFNKGHPFAVLDISNNNRQLLELTKRTLGGNISHN